MTKTNQPTNKENMTHKKAIAAGIKAFEDGKSGTICEDNDFMKAACGSSNDTVGLFDSYNKGWHLANAAHAASDALPHEVAVNMPSVKALAGFKLANA